jgi:uncharacterized protein (DUF2062 family)
MSFIAWFREQWDRLVHLKDKPHAVAVGASVGVFFGFIPLVGLKTLLAIGSTRLLRGSVIAAAIAVTLHDVILPFMPLLLRWEYDLGYWLLHHPHELPPHLHLHEHSPLVWLHWSSFFTVGRPLLLGALIIAVPSAVVTYFLVLKLLARSSRGPNNAVQPPMDTDGHR